MSGIMVDGIGNLCVINDSEVIEGGFADCNGLACSEHRTERTVDAEEVGQQDFKDADLIVIGCSEKDLIKTNVKGIDKGFGKKDCFQYPMWAVYGNVVVESSIHKGNMIDYKKSKTKIVWSHKKPYILSGD